MESIKKKWLWGIFISLLAFFAMSHNASAIDINLNNYEVLYSTLTPNMSCYLKGGVPIAPSLSCSFVGTTDEIKVDGIYATSPFSNLKKGDIFEYFIFIGNRLNNNISGGIITLQQARGHDGLITLNVEEVDNYNLIDIIGVSSNDNLSDIYNLYKFGKLYKITQYVATDGNYAPGLDVNTSASSVFLFSFYQNVNYSVSIKLFNVVVYRSVESKENKEVEEKTQEAVDDSQAAGGSSSSSAQSGTTGLLNAITGAVNVISSASPTNCKINGNMGNLDIGQLDLCANPAPTFIQTIGSLILILMCVPLAISLFNRFIAIFRSFQS